MSQTIESEILGLRVEITKTWTYYDTGLEPWVHLEPGSYDYHLKAWGNLGETFIHPFDGQSIQWRRVAINRAGESTEYIAESINAKSQ